jgi:uncharacterized membrane protein
MDYFLSTEVKASPVQIWDLLVDVERWPLLTKSMTEVKRSDSGPLIVGSEATVKQPRLPRSVWRVTCVIPYQRFTWQATTGGVTSIGDHVIESTANGSHVTLTLNQHGQLVWLTDLLFGSRAKEYLAMELDGFRRGAEALAQVTRVRP